MPKAKQPAHTDIIRGKGQPRQWEAEQDLQDSFMGYIQHCLDQRLQPNVSGFCAFANCTRETYYKQQDYYPDTYAKIRLALEDSLINYQKFTGMTNPAMAITQGKNTFKWDDSGRGGEQGRTQDVDFDAPEDEIDALMGTLGYAPKLING